MDPDSTPPAAFLSLMSGGNEAASPNLFWYILLLLVLIGINAFFASGEIAVVALNDQKLKKMADDGDKKAKILLRFTQTPSSFLATIQVGVTLSGFISSALAADTFADSLVSVLSFLPVSAGVLRAVSLFLITLILSFLSLIFGELVPKRIAMQTPERVAYFSASILLVVYRAMKPVVWLLSKTTNGVVRLFGIDPSRVPEGVTEEEIRMMVDVGNEKGVIEESQKDMINNVFEFDDRDAAEVMTHRTEIMAVDIEAKISDIVYIAINEGFSRIPVYREDIDNIVGVLYVKDLLCLVGCNQSGDFKIEDFIREALYIPETCKCKEIFKLLTAKKMHMAIVVDEYGGTAGLVTMEDLLESIVGNIQDEYDDEEEEVTQIGEGRFTIDGAASLEEVEKLLDIRIEESDYDTLGGLITGILGRIPSEEEHPQITLENVSFTVTLVEDRRIAKVLAEKKPGEGGGEETDKEKILPLAKSAVAN